MNNAMRGFVESMLAAAALAMSALPALAQNNSGLRPGTDSSVTTGVGTGSTFRNVAPPPNQPPIGTSRNFMPDTPEANEKPAGEDGKDNKDRDKAAAAPAPEVKEDPRTMITRDRIQSPQH
jgi:hypothetical protein